MISKEELYAQCEDLFGYKPLEDWDIYESIDMTIDLLSEIYGEDLHFEPLFEQIKIKLDYLLNESNEEVESADTKENRQEKTDIQD